MLDVRGVRQEEVDPVGGCPCAGAVEPARQRLHVYRGPAALRRARGEAVAVCAEGLGAVADLGAPAEPAQCVLVEQQAIWTATLGVAEADAAPDADQQEAQQDLLGLCDLGETRRCSRTTTAASERRSASRRSWG